jgi:hypothetical protein
MRDKTSHYHTPSQILAFVMQYVNNKSLNTYRNEVYRVTWDWTTKQVGTQLDGYTYW